MSLAERNLLRLEVVMMKRSSPGVVFRGAPALGLSQWLPVRSARNHNRARRRSRMTERAPDKTAQHRMRARRKSRETESAPDKTAHGGNRAELKSHATYGCPLPSVLARRDFLHARNRRGADLFPGTAEVFCAHNSMKLLGGELFPAS